MPTEAKQATVARAGRAASRLGRRPSSPTTAACTVADLHRVRTRAPRARASATGSSRTGWRRIAAEQAGRPELIPLLIGPHRGRRRRQRRGSPRQGRPRRPATVPSVEIRGGAIERPHGRRGGRHALADAAPARRAAGPAGRRHGLAAEHDGRAARGAAAQPGLRPRRSCATSARPPDPTPRRAGRPTATRPRPGRNDTMATKLTQDQHPRGHRRHDRPRAVRVHQDVRGALRRHRRRARGRRRRRPGGRRAAAAEPSRSRPSSAPCSPRSAPTRSPSSRSCAS